MHHLQAWYRKPALRFMYREWFKALAAHLAPGTAVEIGCGIGRLKEQIEDLITLDLFKSPWTDIVGDAQKLPLKSDSISNLILFDVLHHLPKPMLFLDEALRVLKSGGRLAMLEPYVSPVSKAVYTLFHPEPLDMDCDPFQTLFPMSSDRPFDGNQALATLIFFKEARRWQEKCAGFQVVKRSRFAFFAYPASGGLGKRQLLPDKFIRAVHRMESKFSPLAGLLAFRVLIVLEKKQTPVDLNDSLDDVHKNGYI